MSSIKREYSQGASTPTAVTVTGGNGSNSGNNVARVFIDTHVNSVFTVDISTMLGDASGHVNVNLDTVAGAPGALAGKEVTVIFSANSTNNTVYATFTDKFGPHASDLYINMRAGTDSMPMAMKLMSDGTDFVLIDKIHNIN